MSLFLVLEILLDLSWLVLDILIACKASVWFRQYGTGMWDLRTPTWQQRSCLMATVLFHSTSMTWRRRTSASSFASTSWRSVSSRHLRTAAVRMSTAGWVSLAYCELSCWHDCYLEGKLTNSFCQQIISHKCPSLTNAYPENRFLAHLLYLSKSETMSKCKHYMKKQKL